MENISVAVITDDREYGRALGLSLLSVCRTFIIKVILKENFTEIVEHIYSDNRTLSEEYDLILWDGTEVSEVYGGNLVMMTEKPSMAVRDHKDKRFSIYKYDSAQIMVGNLFEIYACLTGREPVNIRKSNVRLFDFASCAGGCGCTTLAMAVCQDLSRFHGAKVLYLSFEDIEPTGEFIENVRSISPLSHYLYTLFRENRTGSCVSRDLSDICGPRQRGFLESYIVRDEFGIEAFAPSGGRNPLAGLESRETVILLSALIESGRYDAIVTDTGDRLDDAALTCAEMAEKICFVTAGNVNDRREEQFLQHLMLRCGENITEKILKVRNKVNRREAVTDSIAQGESMIDTSIYIGKTNSIIRAGKVRKIILENDFGSKVDMITKRLTEPRVC